VHGSAWRRWGHRSRRDGCWAAVGLRTGRLLASQPDGASDARERSGTARERKWQVVACTLHQQRSGLLRVGRVAAAAAGQAASQSNKQMPNSEETAATSSGTEAKKKAGIGRQNR
jgi:hypothetical protein